MKPKKTSLTLDKEITRKLQERGYNVSKCVRNYLSALEKKTRLIEVIVPE